MNDNSGMSSGTFSCFADFYPFYLSQHADRTCRRLHFVGTSLGAAAILLSLSTLNFWWLLAGLVAGYGCAWIGHFVVEKNRPATFTYPLWSLISDYKMFGLFVTGQLGKELMKHQIRSP